MPLRVFISAVTREFGAARDDVANRLQARGLHVEVQRSFKHGGGSTLAKLHDYIQSCDRVIAIIGAYSGMFPPEGAVTDEYRAMLPPKMTRASLTQWEVIFARHHKRWIRFFEAAGHAPERPPADDDDAAAQANWRQYLFDGGIGQDRVQFANGDRLLAEVMALDWPNAAKPNNLPGSIGHLFKGREGFLDQLRASFAGNPATAITGKAVHGLGGIGKTRVAIEYGHAHRADYTAQFFLIGKSPSDLENSLANLAGAAVLDLPEQALPDLEARVAAVKRWLAANRGWFLIIDNVDSPEATKAVKALLNQVSGAGGHVLITSRISNWGHLVTPLELDLLSVDAAKALLLAATPRRTMHADEDAALTRLADAQLGCLSLALVQAAAYIDTKRIGFADYVALFERQSAKLLAALSPQDQDNINYPRAVAITWQTSVEQLGDASRLLLDMLAFLSIEPIPRSLFDVWPASDGIDLREALSQLSDYSLVHWEENNSAITVHRLVAHVTRNAISVDARDRALNALFPWLFAVNPTMNAGDVRCWPKLLPLLPHVLALFERTHELGPFASQTLLFDEYATLLQGVARYGEAEPIFRRALAINQDSYGLDHPKVSVGLNNLAMLLKATNRLAEAESMYRRALAIDEVSHGPDHPLVAIELNNLASLLKTTNRLAEAEPMFRRALAINEAGHGPNHPKVAAGLNNLAELLRATNRLAEAEPIYRRALIIDEASYGPDHPEVAVDLNNLAGLLRETNRLAEAEPMFRRALKISEASYGPDHPKVAIRLNNLAVQLKDTNRLAEAELMYRRAAMILLHASQASGHLLPNTAVIVQNWADALGAQGQTDAQARSTISALIADAGLDPTTMLPLIFGDPEA